MDLQTIGQSALRTELELLYCPDDGCQDCQGCDKARERLEELKQKNLTLSMLDQLLKTQTGSPATDGMPGA